MTPGDEQWMREAMALARLAESEGEVPVGAVVVQDGEVVGRGWNRTIGLNDPSAHAEIMAMREAGRALGNYRLPGCELYVTLEPCCMCAGAIVHARVARVVFAAPDPKTGAAGGAFDLLPHPQHNHQLIVEGGLLEDESAALLRGFFRARRGGGAALAVEDDSAGSADPGVEPEAQQVEAGDAQDAENRQP
ncbi:tRNA adenosine(34) deaminase TadA [Marinihelvus fidelis]|uniref:tRNA-specific adenosine deaminase n=1 Tax=Marinihelvus fidelis TaxID=2613842 RepID=A0A5N0TDY6_9GAMM|nr:tRNA adenosine(34) deaminase TadA [Marinihelvus fidelis]KAA9133252.1 tRNA adenosine(34) deaminase TadA [Marinihelvus fidelis]